MMANPNIKWNSRTDSAIIKQIGSFIKKVRTEQVKTQAQLAEMTGLNRWTISQIENGESINLSSLIQILRSLDSLYVFNEFEISEEISPLEYAKLKKQQKVRVRNKIKNEPEIGGLGW